MTSINQSDLDCQPVWDRPALLERMQGGENRLQGLIDIFIKTIPERITALQEQIIAQNAEQVVFEAHTIKGACASLSALQLYHLTAGIEAQARANQIMDLMAVIPLLDDYYQALEQQLSSR